MRWTLLILMTATLFCSPLDDVESFTSLSDQSFKGKIYAKGVYSLFGLIKVEGVLSFSDSLLYWSTNGSLDSIPYQWRVIDDHIMFTASAMIENNETIEWRGFFHGDHVEDVHATWQRQKGDFIHDLFLPNEVTLVFKAKK